MPLVLAKTTLQGLNIMTMSLSFHQPHCDLKHMYYVKFILTTSKCVCLLSQ